MDPYLGIFLILSVIMVVATIAEIREHKRKQTPNPITFALTGDSGVGGEIPFIRATREQRLMVMDLQNHRCANPYCNVDLRNCTPHWDHIIPRVKGGTDSVHNMQYLCETCNLNKRDTDWPMFLYQCAISLGQDPNKNQDPWKKWIYMRHRGGLYHQ